MKGTSPTMTCQILRTMHRYRPTSSSCLYKSVSAAAALRASFSKLVIESDMKLLVVAVLVALAAIWIQSVDGECDTNGIEAVSLESLAKNADVIAKIDVKKVSQKRAKVKILCHLKVNLERLKSEGKVAALMKKPSLNVSGINDYRTCVFVDKTLKGLLVFVVKGKGRWEVLRHGVVGVCD